MSDASRILRARGSPCTPKALNLRQIVNLVQNNGDILVSAGDLIRGLINFAEDRDTDAILARRELRSWTYYLIRVRRVKQAKEWL
jgi:hypothetical protein